MKYLYVKARAIFFLTLVLSLLLVASFLLAHQERNPLLVGGWESDGAVAYSLWFYANGRGHVLPEHYSINWHTRSEILEIASLGVVREYEYFIIDGVRLILTQPDHTATIHKRTYTRVGY